MFAIAALCAAMVTNATGLRPGINPASDNDAATAARGKALFIGAEPVTGRIREHENTLPAAVLTCANCHASHTQPAVKGSDAPVLSAGLLADRRSRRHGPASAYDAHSFCRVLRTGVDPVFVLLDHVMPVYQVTDAQCQSLWRYLQEPDIDSSAKDSYD